jgi:hypothetical protein
MLPGFGTGTPIAVKIPNNAPEEEEEEENKLNYIV